VFVATALLVLGAPNRGWPSPAAAQARAVSTEPGSTTVAPPAQSTRSALERLMASGLPGAQAVLTQAEYRQEQAANGLGGLGARTEDIVQAQARLVGARVALRLRLPFDDVKLLRGFVLLAEGLVESAKKRRDACGEQEATVKFELDKTKLDQELDIGINCPDDLKAALEAAIDVARAALKSAELTYKFFTDPDPQVANELAPYEQAVKKSELEIAKLKTGGFRDDATRTLDVARARGDVDTLAALVAGSATDALRAQLARAIAERDETRVRQTQAKEGKGGRDVRAEDIGQAQADLISAKADLALLLDPIGEDVGKLKAAVDGARAAVRVADKLEDACGDIELHVRLDRNGAEPIESPLTDSIDLPIFPGGPPIHLDLFDVRLASLKSTIDTLCTGDKRRALGAVGDAARASLTIAEQNLKLLVGPAEPQVLNVIEPKKQAIVAAAARLKKLQTGGREDATTLQLQAELAQADVDALEALIAGSMPQFVAGRLRGAQAEQREARYRIDQAKDGRGGIDARTEDIEEAEAELAARRADLALVLDPLQETVQIARAEFKRTQAVVREAEWRRQACSGPISETRTKLTFLVTLLGVEKEVERESRTRSSDSCSKDLEQALDHVVERAKAERDVAHFQLDILIAPSAEQTSYTVGLARTAVAAAAARVQKLRTGGSFDAVSLTHRLERAEAAVEFWEATRDGSKAGQVAAQLRAARADLVAAEYRVVQARQGQGGVDARAEDIMVADARLAAARLELAKVVKPTPEQVGIAEARVRAAMANVDAARKFRDACDDPRTVAVPVDNDNSDGDDSGDNENDNETDNEGDTERKITTVKCSSGRVAALNAEIDRARALLTVAEQDLKLLTDPAQPQILNVIAPYQQAVVAADAQVRKLKSGGSRDATSLALDVATAGAEVNRLEAVLAGSTRDELAARVHATTEQRRVAGLRVEQAVAGLGGADARAEDIAIAEADLAANTARLQALLDPPVETVARLTALVDAADAEVRVAKGRRDACGHDDIESVKKERGHTSRTVTVVDPNCSDYRGKQLDTLVDIAREEREVAIQQRKLVVDPAQPEILSVVDQYLGRIEASAARLQKLKTGGTKDLARLKLDVSVAQAELDRWQAASAGSLDGQAAARLAAAVAIGELTDADVERAKLGEGGPHVRSEDIAIAAGELKARTGEYTTITNPPQEIVAVLTSGVTLSKLDTLAAWYAVDACGDQKYKGRIENRAKIDHDGDPAELPLRFKIEFNCPDDQYDALFAIFKGREGFELVPAAFLSLATQLCCNEKLQVLVAGKKALVVIAEQEVKKEQTGGPDDASTLALRSTLARVQVDCRKAAVDLAKLGEVVGQEWPFAWSDPDPCSLAQLPGKSPPFAQLDVRPATPAPRLAITPAND
jgi:hypothetical protein